MAASSAASSPQAATGAAADSIVCAKGCCDALLPFAPSPFQFCCCVGFFDPELFFCSSFTSAGLLLSSFGLFFDLLERTEFPPWLKTTQAVASALLVPTTVPLIMARFRVRRGAFASPARGPTVSHTGLRRHGPHHIL